MKLKTVNNFEIYTDASFDDNSKLVTYAVVIIKEEKILEVFFKTLQIRRTKVNRG